VSGAQFLRHHADRAWSIASLAAEFKFEVGGDDMAERQRV
jgi:hypothetical protein